MDKKILEKPGYFNRYLFLLWEILFIDFQLSFRLVRNPSDGFTEGFPMRFAYGNDKRYWFIDRLCLILPPSCVSFFDAGQFQIS